MSNILKESIRGYYTIFIYFIYLNINHLMYFKVIIGAMESIALINTKLNLI